MSMEKRGVVSDENEAPKTEKAAAVCEKETCCGQSCGSDTISKMADVASKPAEIKDK